MFSQFPRRSDQARHGNNVCARENNGYGNCNLSHDRIKFHCKYKGRDLRQSRLPRKNSTLRVMTQVARRRSEPRGDGQLKATRFNSCSAAIKASCLQLTIAPWLSNYRSRGGGGSATHDLLASLRHRPISHSSLVYFLYSTPRFHFRGIWPLRPRERKAWRLNAWEWLSHTVTPSSIDCREVMEMTLFKTTSRTLSDPQVANW